MKQQTYIIKNCSSFELEHIFECGQCFRWERQEDGSYNGVVGDGVLNIAKQGKDFIVSGNANYDIPTMSYSYFDLGRDYEKIKENLLKNNPEMQDSILYGKGIRILNQELWETVISFVLSANNNIPRIKKMITNLSKTYGKKINWKGKEYFTFPTPKELEKASVEDLRKLGLGFRDKRVYELAKMVREKRLNLEEIQRLESTEEIREKLLQLPGVGPKVADCILLFSTLKRLEVFPIDVWINRIMSNNYLHKDPSIVKRKEIEELARQKYGNLAGIAQQYLFYWGQSNTKRNVGA